MIKRKLNPKELSPTAAKIKKVKDKLSEVGIKFFNNKEWDNFQVYPMGDRRGESSTYDTGGNSDGDLQDALNTGLDMAKRLGKGYPNFSNIGKKANPKCRTIKVRRKISMGKGKRPRILQVRRKVCNPEGLDLENVREKLEYFWLEQSIVKIKSNNKKDFEGLIKPNNEYINWFKVYNYDNEFNVIWIKLNNVLEIKGNTIKVSDYRTSLSPPISDRR